MKIFRENDFTKKLKSRNLGGINFTKFFVKMISRKKIIIVPSAAIYIKNGKECFRDTYTYECESL